MHTTSLNGVPVRPGPGGRPAGCLICGKPLTFHQQVSWQICDHWQCTSALLQQALHAHRGAAAAAVGEFSPESYPVVVVPGDPGHIDRLPQSRKQAHIDFLYDLSAGVGDAAEGGRQAAAAAAAVPNVPEPPAVMVSQVCAVCRGSCCRPGQTHAYLDRADLGRFSARTRITGPLEIVYAYCAFLPEMSVVDSCVYQTAAGCALPRWMRAGTCTAYRCNGLKQAGQLLRQQGGDRLFVAVRRDSRIRRSAFVRPDSIHHYPLPGPVCADTAGLTTTTKEN